MDSIKKTARQLTIGINAAKVDLEEKPEEMSMSYPIYHLDWEVLKSFLEAKFKQLKDNYGAKEV